MIIVSDTSPISNLVIVNHVHLLPDIFGTIIIPKPVHTELLANGPGHPVTLLAQSADWLEIGSVKDLAAVAELENNRNLDPGEAHAIVLASELNAHQLLIDERLGRTEAQRLGLSIVGILGVLLLAKQRQLITSVKPVMDDLINQANFRIRPRLYAEVLKRARESVK